MSAASLPLIDISPFLPSTPLNPKARKACAKQIYDACTTTGFFYLTNHGIPLSETDAVLALGRDFFLNCSQDEKRKIIRRKVGEGNGDGTRGWQPLRDNVTGGKRDWQEAVDFYREGDAKSSPPYEFLQGKNLWPEKPAELQQVYEDYVDHVLNLGEVLLTAMGAALGEGNEEIFVKHARKSFWGLRLIGYSPIPKPENIPPEQNDDGISCGAHTDYGCVTFLLQDKTKGALQVRSTSGDWINADPIPGAFVVNIGDMMERWTNGLWKSTVHRVVHRGEEFRVSVPLFYEPDFDAVIKPLQVCIDRTGGVAKYSEKVYGQHLLSKVSKNFYSGVGKAPAIAAPAPELTSTSVFMSSYGGVADVLYRTWRYMYAWRA